MMTVRNQIEAVLAKPAIVQPVSRLLLKQLLAEHDARVKVLEDALRCVVSVAKDAHSHWDADQDSKVGKYLLALAGFNAGYDKRTDEVHAALNQTPKA